MKTKAIAVGFALCGLAMALPAAAAGSYTLTVNATVVGTCKFTPTTTGSVSVTNNGTNIDPSLATAATGTKTITYKCTSGVTPAMAFAGANDPSVGVHEVKSTATPTNLMLYTVGTTALGAGTGFGAAAQSVDVTVTIAAADYQNAAAAADYTDTLTISITP